MLGLFRVTGSILASLEIAQGDSPTVNINTLIHALINHDLKRPPDKKSKEIEERRAVRRGSSTRGLFP